MVLLEKFSGVFASEEATTERDKELRPVALPFVGEFKGSGV
jgi:hypothetical protein